MNDPRDQFLETLPKGGSCVEVGVRHGDFSERILRICMPDRLVLVDPWMHRDEAKYEGAIYGPSVEQDALDVMYDDVMSRFDTDDRVCIVRATSADAAAMHGPKLAFAGEQYDWVYIDGDHLDVATDLEAWWLLVKPGGLLTGDDYANTNRWWGNAVVDDVDAFAAKHGLDVEVIVERQFVLRKPL